MEFVVARLDLENLKRLNLSHFKALHVVNSTPEPNV